MSKQNQYPKLNIFNKVIAHLRLQEAIRQANEAHLLHGDRYFVMPSSGVSGKLIIVNRKTFRQLKQKRYITNSAKVLNLLQECFYCTATKQPHTALSEQEIKAKRKSYFSWVAAVKQSKQAISKNKKRH